MELIEQSKYSDNTRSIQFNYYLKLVLKHVKKENALGLVEALIALAVVGTGMVILTTISLKTIRQARKNELQDVAVQAAVEALDFMKDPSTIDTDRLPADQGSYYRLDLASSPPLIWVADGNLNPDESLEIDSCTEDNTYYVSSLPDYFVCQQIFVQNVGTKRYDLKVIVVWKTIGGDYEKQDIEGYRLGSIAT